MPVLEELTWLEAEALLTPETVVVIPLGAAAKEHGPHLKLKNDFTIAEYLKTQVLDMDGVVVAPTVAYSFYPAFVDYPGSISLSLETSAAMIVEICESLARFGPRRFYIINTGISTLRVMTAAQEKLAATGITLNYTDLEAAIKETVSKISQQKGGSHADEIETSMMLHIAASDVNMQKAAKDWHEPGKGRLSRTKVDGCAYSPSGVWGDATLATAEKGKLVVQSLVAAVIRDIHHLQQMKSPADGC